MANRIQIRRDTAANWTSVNPVLTQGEVGEETDTRKIKIGDGSTAWNSLVYAFSRAPIMALEAVQFTNFGDSYGDGNQGADQASRPFDRLVMRQRTQPLVHHAQAGTRMDQVLSQIQTYWIPNSRGLVGFSDGCINDEKQYGNNAGATTTREAFRSCLAYLTAQNVTPYTGAAFVFGPNWASGTSSTVNSYVDVAFTGATAYLLISCVTGTGGTVEVRNSANTAIASISTGGFNQNFTGCVKMTGTSGTNSYRLVLTAGSATIVGVAATSPTPPVILWDKPGQINSSSTETTLLAYYQSTCAAILSDFPTVVQCDMGSGWDYTTMISSDNTHRNDKGNRYATEVIESALITYLGTNFQQGLNALTYTTGAAAYTVPTPSYLQAGASAPAAPGSFTATAANQVSFTWTTPTDGGATITGYAIQSSPAGANTWTNLANPPVGATSYTVASGLTASTSYDFRIAAINSVGTGTYSATSTATAGASVTTYASDTFTRSALGSTETGGYAWTTNNSSTSWSCNGSQLVCASGSAIVENDCYINDAQSDGTISVQRVVNNANSGLAFRITGTNDVNGYIFWLNGSTWTLSRRNASNSYTSLGTSTLVAPAANQTISVVLSGSSITCKVAGTTVITATDATYTSTKHGVWANSNAGMTFDNFSHTS